MAAARARKLTDTISLPVPLGRWPDVGPRYVLELLDEAGVVAGEIPLHPGHYLVGTLPECAIQLDSSGVSHQHARIEVLADGGVIVTDLQSKNGTWVDGRPIQRLAFDVAVELRFGAVAARVRAADDLTPDGEPQTRRRVGNGRRRPRRSPRASRRTF